MNFHSHQKFELYSIGKQNSQQSTEISKLNIKYFKRLSRVRTGFLKVTECQNCPCAQGQPLVQVWAHPIPFSEMKPHPRHRGAGTGTARAELRAREGEGRGCQPRLPVRAAVPPVPTPLAGTAPGTRPARVSHPSPHQGLQGWHLPPCQDKFLWEPQQQIQGCSWGVNPARRTGFIQAGANSRAVPPFPCSSLPSCTHFLGWI